MNKNLLILIILAIFCIGLSISSVSAIDNSNSMDDLNSISDSDSIDNLNAADEINREKLEKCDDEESSENSTLRSSSDDGLSSSVSVSTGHTYSKCGYKFTVSPYQYSKIKEAIKAGKKQKFLDWGFDFKVKTNKVVKVKVLVKSKTYYKKVRYEKFVYPYTVKTANLKYYYNQGWKKYSSEWHQGNHYAYLKKTVKTYKTVTMRVYALIGYVGEYDYDYGEHGYYPWVSFEAMKRGYSSKYLTGTLLM